MEFVYYFEIADITIRLVSDRLIKVNKPFKPFCNEKPVFDYEVRLRNVETLIYSKRNLVYKSDLFNVFMDNLQVREFYSESVRNSYAITHLDFKNKLISIDYLTEGLGHFTEVGNTFFHIGWENVLAYENRIILHSCCVKVNNLAILFAGSSGVGKSTQGDLWVRFEHAEIINGDRTILYKENGQWVGYGSPYAGSSKYYKNKKAPIKAIVMLKQSSDCHIEQLLTGEAFKRLYAMTTVCNWDEEATGKICDQIISIACDIPVYEFSCTPDRDAVDFLKEAIGNR